MTDSMAVKQQIISKMTNWQLNQALKVCENKRPIFTLSTDELMRFANMPHHKRTS